MEKSTILDDAFDVEHEEGTPPRALVPNGWYDAEVTDASVSKTKNGAGQMVNLTWTISDGEFENRIVFQGILIQHTSADARRFGRQKFKDICAACGVTGPVTDLTTLQYKKCNIYVGVERDKTGEYEPKNKVARVRSYAASGNGSRPKAGATITPSADLNDKIPF
jgi:hypothetical protein